MFNFKYFLGVIFIGILLTGSTFSQWHDRGHHDFEKRRKRMEKFRTWKMTEYLDLTPDQSQQFFPRLNQYEKKIHQNHREIKKLVMEINDKFDNENYKPTEKDYQHYLDRFMKIEKRRLEHKKEFLENVDSILSTEQKIKFLIFDDKFKHDIMLKLRKKHFLEKEDNFKHKE